MKSRKRILVGIAAFFAVLVLLPFALPLGVFIPEVELAASEQLKAPVKIDSLRLFLLPYPHLTIKGISAGKKPFLEVEKVIVTPALASLFSAQKVIREISLRGVVVGQAMIPKATALASAPSGKGPARVRIERIELRDAFVNLNDLKLRDIDLDIELTPQGGLSRAQLGADHGHFTASLVPSGKEFSVQIDAHDWKLPAGPPLLISTLTTAGTLNLQTGLWLPAIEAKVYDGTLSGTFNVAWGNAWSIAANLSVHGVEIRPVVALFTKDTTISGKLSATPIIDIRAPTAAKLAEALDVESDFSVQNGVLYNFDLANAPKALLNKDALKGGETRFDKFAGHLSVDAQGYYLTKVEIASGLFTAEAQVDISTKQELSGQVDVAIKGTSALVSTPLAISGTVQNPSLYPSKAALAGAAAGTALLGPGLGTSVGMRAARMTQRLFGGKPAKKKPAEPEKKPEDAAAATEPPRKGPIATSTGR